MIRALTVEKNCFEDASMPQVKDHNVHRSHISLNSHKDQRDNNLSAHKLLSHQRNYRHLTSKLFNQKTIISLPKVRTHLNFITIKFSDI